MQKSGIHENVSYNSFALSPRINNNGYEGPQIEHIKDLFCKIKKHFEAINRS